MTTSQLLQMISEFPLTSDLSVMEQFARMDVQVTPDGQEWYATFTKDQISGNLIQITEWEHMEGAWESYQALFCGETE